MNKKGFTLVELMVVIVIIGVLAAVAIPKMMAATNKAKASEGPQILGAIARLQLAYRAERDGFISCAASSTGETPPTAASGSWAEIGFDIDPYSKYFQFQVTAGESAAAAVSTFTANATLYKALGTASSGNGLQITQAEARNVTGTSSAELQKLVPNWK
jgi:prepilin-type N-terminal cleavage/methylation domain-containing protein